MINLRNLDRAEMAAALRRSGVGADVAARVFAAVHRDPRRRAAARRVADRDRARAVEGGGARALAQASPRGPTWRSSNDAAPPTDS